VIYGLRGGDDLRAENARRVGFGQASRGNGEAVDLADRLDLAVRDEDALDQGGARPRQADDEYSPRAAARSRVAPLEAVRSESLLQGGDDGALLFGGPGLHGFADAGAVLQAVPGIGGVADVVIFLEQSVADAARFRGVATREGLEPGRVVVVGGPALQVGQAVIGGDRLVARQGDDRILGGFGAGNVAVELADIADDRPSLGVLWIKHYGLFGQRQGLQRQSGMTEGQAGQEKVSGVRNAHRDRRAHRRYRFGGVAQADQRLGAQDPHVDLGL